MAVINPTVVTDQDGVTKVTWANLKDNDTGKPVRLGRYADKTAQVIVNVSGAGDAVLMEGSQDATNFGGLHDPQGNLMNASGGFVGATLTDLLVISESPEELRPNVTGGNPSTDLTVIVTMPTRGR